MIIDLPADWHCVWQLSSCQTTVRATVLLFDVEESPQCTCLSHTHWGWTICCFRIEIVISDNAISWSPKPRFLLCSWLTYYISCSCNGTLVMWFNVSICILCTFLSLSLALALTVALALTLALSLLFSQALWAEHWLPYGVWVVNLILCLLAIFLLILCLQSDITLHSPA